MSRWILLIDRRQPAPIRARAEPPPLSCSRWRCLLAAAATGGTCLAIHGASCTPTSVEWSRLIDRYPAPLISGARPGFSPGRRVVALPVAAPRHLPDDVVPPAPSVPEAASETDAPSPFRPRVPRTPRASRLPSHLYYHKNHHHQPPPPTKPPLTPSIEK